jgi:UDP-N-acetylglucosamine:LPS N-acetylglucosamine transferase
VANARHLAEAGAALVIEDEAFDGAALLEAAAIIHDSERRARMREASRSQGRPGAARATSELLFALGERAPLPHRERIERIARGDA